MKLSNYVVSKCVEVMKLESAYMKKRTRICQELLFRCYSHISCIVRYFYLRTSYDNYQTEISNIMLLSDSNVYGNCSEENLHSFFVFSLSHLTSFILKKVILCFSAAFM